MPSRISQHRPATVAHAPSKPAAKARPQAQASTKPTTGWNPSSTSPSAQAKALAAKLHSPAGAKQAQRIVETVAKKSELARGLNWEAGDITSVKANKDGTFTVNLTLDVLQNNGQSVQKNYFNAIVDGSGKVLDVPQG